jgi:hypothetical protein
VTNRLYFLSLGLYPVCSPRRKLHKISPVYQESVLAAAMVNSDEKVYKFPESKTIVVTPSPTVLNVGEILCFPLEV